MRIVLAMLIESEKGLRVKLRRGYSGIYVRGEVPVYSILQDPVARDTRQHLNR